MAASPAQKSKAAALLACSDLTHTEIADEVGIAARTLYRWMDDPAFRGQIQGVIDAAEMGIRSRLRAEGLTFVEALVEVAKQGEGPNGTGRASAADRGLKYILGERRTIEHAGSVGLGGEDPEKIEARIAELRATLADDDYAGFDGDDDGEE